MPAQVTIRSLSVTYTAPGGEPLPAVRPVSLTLAAGQFVCLVGPSGCGKSTLIRVLAGLQAPTKGDVLIDGEPVTAPSPRVALMFQDANLMPWRTVTDNIALPLELAGVPKDARIEQVRGLLPRLGLAEFAHAHPGELSGGMAQRVALGRVLVQHPDLLLLDEPFGALDALTREKISEDLLNVWRQTQPTVLMVTHDIHEAVLLADRVLVMSRRPGQIIADVSVPLARPRALNAIYSSEFGEIARLVRANIERA